MHPGAPEGRFYLLARVQIFPVGLMEDFASRPECIFCIQEGRIKDTTPECNNCTQASRKIYCQPMSNCEYAYRRISPMRSNFRFFIVNGIHIIRKFVLFAFKVSCG